MSVILPTDLISSLDGQIIVPHIVKDFSYGVLASSIATEKIKYIIIPFPLCITYCFTL